MRGNRCLFVHAGETNGRARSAREQKLPPGHLLVAVQVDGLETNFARESWGPGTTEVRGSVPFRCRTSYTRMRKTHLKYISSFRIFNYFIPLTAMF